MNRILLLIIITFLASGNIFAAKKISSDDAEWTPAEKQYLSISVESARVRESPSFDAPVEYGLLRGETALLLKKEGNWFYIMRDDGKKGWGYRTIFDFTSDITSVSQDETALDRTIAGLIKTEQLNPDAASPDNKTVTENQDSSLPVTEDTIEKNKAPSEPAMDVKWESEERVSVNFLDIDIREALTAIALEKEINITSSQEVTGSITVHLYNLTLDEALDAITMAGGYTYLKKGNLYFVFKPKQEKDPQEDRLQMKVFKIEYADLDKVQDILTAVAGTHVIRIHEPTRTIVVEETPENLAKIESILKQWDRKPRQVMIEAKILEVKLTDGMSFGVNWSKILGDVRVGTGSFSSAALPSGTPVSPVPSTGTGMFANMITAAGTDHQFSAALDALQAKTRINILSTPKILAIHGKPAKVQVGGQQGYKVVTTNEGVSTESVEFIDTGTILDITPYIDDDNSILLDVKPSIKSARIEEGVPVVNSTEVSTWLTAKDGETLFIGGLIQDSKTKTREAVPCLGGIPGLGAAFGRTSREIDKTELVILITPNIIKDGPGIEDMEAIKRTKTIERLLRKENSISEDAMDFIKPVE